MHEKEIVSRKMPDFIVFASSLYDSKGDITVDLECRLKSEDQEIEVGLIQIGITNIWIITGTGSYGFKGMFYGQDHIHLLTHKLFFPDPSGLNVWIDVEGKFIPGKEVRFKIVP